MKVHDVIIIGAGMAGLTAAYELRQRGVKDIVILEAQDYVGGRTRTAKPWGEPVDMGGEFIHGSDVVTWEYIKKFNLETVRAEGRSKLYDSHGHLLTHVDREEYDRLSEALVRHGKYGASVAEITKQYTRPDKLDIMNLLNNSVADYEAGDADVLDSGSYAEMERLTAGNGSNYVMKHGYGELVGRLSRDSIIHLNAIVETVSYHEGGGEVVLSNGQTYSSRFVVVTVPIGVLQTDAMAFYPALPEGMRSVIERLGMGNSIKLLLKFNTSVDVHTIFKIADGENETNQTITCWWASGSDPSVLVGFVGGRRAAATLALDESELVHRALLDLSQIKRADLTKELIDYRLVRWDTNPFVRGSYSNHPIGVRHSERASLAQPINETLFIAGEATVVSGNYATVHGAIESGQRVAKQILALCKTD